MVDKFLALAFVAYLIGIPVSFGAALKMAPHPAPMFIAPIWPAVALGYIGYRLAP
jgi:hypothetical protein